MGVLDRAFGMSARRLRRRMQKELIPTAELVSQLKKYYFPYWAQRLVHVLPLPRKFKRAFWELFHGDLICFHSLRRHGFFQIWTKELVGGLAAHICERLAPLDSIIEVGGGNGLLTQNLRQLGLDVVAVDARLGEWKFLKRIPRWVKRMCFREALVEYRPRMVISSWMPPRQDWTPIFRACPSVQTYILIGEPTDEEQIDGAGARATWKECPGWKREVLDELTPYSYFYADFERHQRRAGRKSIVVAYTREGAVSNAPITLKDLPPIRESVF